MVSSVAPIASTSAFVSHRSAAPVLGSFAGFEPEDNAPDEAYEEPKVSSKGKGKKRATEKAYRPPVGTAIKPPPPAPAPIVLPSRTLDFSPQTIAPEYEAFYQSAEASGVLAHALQRSRARWLNGGVLQKFSSSSKSKKAAPIWQPPHNLSALGKFTVEIGPHIFSETKMWEVRWLSNAPPQPAPSHSGLSQPIAPKAVSPALIAQLSKMAATDAVLADVLSKAANGSATAQELQSLHGYVTALEQQQGASDAVAGFPQLPSESDSRRAPTSSVSAAAKASTRPSAIVIEFKDNPGEKWIVPEHSAIDQVSENHLTLTFWVTPHAELDSKGRPRPPLPAVRCVLQLRDLVEFSVDAFLNLAQTVPAAKRASVWKPLEDAAEAQPQLYLQFRLPYPQGSVGYETAFEAYRAAQELKRKAAPTSAPVSAALPPPAKKQKFVTKKPKAAKAVKGGSVTPKEETPMPVTGEEAPMPVEGAEGGATAMSVG